VSALKRVVLQESLLNDVQPVLTDAFDGQHLLALDRLDGGDATPHRIVAHDHRTSAAKTFAAAG
ncbi:MAG: hypothetical protein WCC89_17650, partial [Candidatus Sulfotelmatobacter sp.]